TVEMILRVQDSDAPVLVRGESGVGKELIARAIHECGRRAKRPFVVQNCSAIHENLLESELFGHVKGSFTGAVKDKAGLFEVANGGTLFLDELGEMSLALQAKLLRVIEYGTFTRVGSSDEVKVDVRIVGATHRHLEEMAEKGTFREDLFYRLNVLSITVPPLRERAEDIPLLAQAFLLRSTERQNKPRKHLTEEALMILCGYSWPGNIRELENEIERVATMSGHLTIVGAGYLSRKIFQGLTLQSIPEQIESESTGTLPEFLFSTQLKDALAFVERAILVRVLDRCHGNKSEAARVLGISRSNLISKAQLYQLEGDGRVDDETP
ncbi:MAG: sigma-54-dependent Fis family transcriptional regulator, partial [Bdellovibrionales bacterium]|nr:sigma-54-dependent Fis family transcriptional regulator [Bdellovibrionales bacterium]